MKAHPRAALAASTILLGLACAMRCAAQTTGEAVPQAAAAQPAAGSRPNVLFIVVDDLNDWVGYLGGNAQSPTPNLDRLARRGVRFTHAYAPVSVCNPSRASILSGVRASTSGVYDNETDWRPIHSESKMLTTQFRNAGYWVAGAGKVHHHHRQSDWDDFTKSEDGFQRRPGDSMHSSSVNDVPDDAMLDHRNVTWLIEQMQNRRDQPVFLAAGLTKPHLPWNVPRRYYDRFPIESIELPPYLETDLDDLPTMGIKMAREIGQGPMPESDHEQIRRTGRWKEAIQGYLAAIAFMDGQIGRLIDALDRSPLRDNTIVVLWSDHGWHLGEKHHWRKQTLWEEATRVPFLWIAPGVTKPDTVCDRTVDLMSIYPTLMALAGLPTPEHVEGKSIRGLLADPTAEWKRPALTTYLFGNHALRTDRWRYIRYSDGGEELYDEVADPQEWKNLAGNPDLASIKAKFEQHLPKVNAPPGPKMGSAAGGG